MSETEPDLAAIVRDIAADMLARKDRGTVATYIPELANVDPQRFGLAIVDVEGNVHAGGDCAVPFSIQSISKVFTLTLALGRVGTGFGVTWDASHRAIASIQLFRLSMNWVCREIPSSMRAQSR